MKSVPTVHPGEVLRKQFLTPMGISQSALARTAGMSTVHIKDIVLGGRDVTVDTDTRLAAALGTDQCFWLELQAEFDLKEACHVRGSSVTQSLGVQARQIGNRVKSAMKGYGSRQVERPKTGPGSLTAV